MIHLSKKVKPILILVAFCLVGIYGCKSKSGAHSADSTMAADSFKMADSAKMMMDTTKKDAVGKDTVEIFGKAPDTGIKNDINPKNHLLNSKNRNLKYGILGYSYPPSIVVGESKNIHAYISIVFPSSKVRDTLLKIILTDDSGDKNDSISITEPMPIYKYVTMKLTPLDTALKVINFDEDSAKQQIDTLNGNKWSWSILATSADHPISKLKLRIATQGPDNYEERTIPISIKLDLNIGRRIYNFLMNNPKVLVVSILIPLISFIGGILLGKRRSTA